MQIMFICLLLHGCKELQKQLHLSEVRSENLAADKAKLVSIHLIAFSFDSTCSIDGNTTAMLYGLGA